MNHISKIVLKFLSILSIIGQIIFSLGCLAIITAAITVFFVKGEAISELYKYILEPNNINKFELFTSCLVAIFITISITLILHFLKRIVDNIYQGKYFVKSNLSSIKAVLIYSIAFTLGNVLSMLLFSNKSGNNISTVFANSWSQILAYVVFVAIIYTLYLIFKYGVALQDDSNNVI